MEGFQWHDGRTVFHTVAHKAKGLTWHELLGYYPNGAPLPASLPPWGIHSPDPEEAPQEAAQARQEAKITRPTSEWFADMQSVLLPARAGIAEDANPKDRVASTKVPMWSLPSIGAVHGAMSTADGIRKGYGAYNWRCKPISMMEHIGALERHIAALKDGEDFTRDSGVTHLGCLIAGASIILDAQQCGTLIDDRPVPGKSTSADTLEDYHGRHSETD